MSELIREEEMPRTRLELRWSRQDDPEWPWRCDYNLVLELWRLDIRGEVFDDAGMFLRHEKEKILCLGTTRADGRHNRLDAESQEIDTPFRDSSHIQWDNKRLGGQLPMYAVCGGYAKKIDPTPHPLPDDAPDPPEGE